MSCSKKRHQIISLYKQALYCPVLIVFKPPQKTRTEGSDLNKKWITMSEWTVLFFAKMVWSSQKQCMFAIFRSILRTSIRDRSRRGKVQQQQVPSETLWSFLQVTADCYCWTHLEDTNIKQLPEPQKTCNRIESLTVPFWLTNGFHRIE